MLETTNYILECGSNNSEKITDLRSMIKKRVKLKNRSTCPCCRSQIKPNKNWEEEVDYIEHLIQPLVIPFEIQSIKESIIERKRKKSEEEEIQIFIDANYGLFKHVLWEYKTRDDFQLPNIPEEEWKLWNTAFDKWCDDSPSRAEFCDNDDLFYKP